MENTKHIFMARDYEAYYRRKTDDELDQEIYEKLKDVLGRPESEEEKQEREINRKQQIDLVKSTEISKSFVKRREQVYEDKEAKLETYAQYRDFLRATNPGRCLVKEYKPTGLEGKEVFSNSNNEIPNNLEEGDVIILYGRETKILEMMVDVTGNETTYITDFNTQTMDDWDNAPKKYLKAVNELREDAKEAIKSTLDKQKEESNVRGGKTKREEIYDEYLGTPRWARLIEMKYNGEYLREGEVYEVRCQPSRYSKEREDLRGVVYVHKIRTNRIVLKTRIGSIKTIKVDNMGYAPRFKRKIEFKRIKTMEGED